MLVHHRPSLKPVSGIGLPWGAVIRSSPGCRKASTPTELGNEGLRQAAIDAGRTPPSDRTLRRWAQQGRIPHPDVLERAQRRAAIERLGGIDAVAAKIGRPRSAVSRYRSGETNELRADASK
jgi:hypothetical protein